MGGENSAAPLECVYECHFYCSEYDGSEHDSITLYRIVKKTKKRIYVEAEPYCEEVRPPCGDWQDYVVKTFVLDRAEFEAEGKARRRKKPYETYYAGPAIYYAERRSKAHRPECFVCLGVPAGATVDEIRSAYRRLAREAHPDAGGSAEAFKGIQKWYEEANWLVNAV